MPEPTPSQLKIDGIVIVPEGTTVEQFKELFTYWLGTTYQWVGNISPLHHNAESFMVEVQRNWLKDKENEILSLREAIEILENSEEANNKAYSDLAEQLRQEKENHQLLINVDNLRQKVVKSQDEMIDILLAKIKINEKRAELKDSPIKAGLKSIWKWFKSTVNQ